MYPAYIGDNFGKEIVLKIDYLDINNKGEFYTDANGLEFQKRVFNFRPTYDLDITEPIAGNFYPVTSAVFTSDFKEKDKIIAFDLFPNLELFLIELKLVEA